MEGHGIKKVGYTHEAMINWMITNPDQFQKSAALYFGVTEGWLSKIVNSDAFRLQLSRRQEAVFSVIAAGIPEKLREATGVSLDKLTDKLRATSDGEFILDAADTLLKASGFAPASQRVAPQTHVGDINQTIVVGAQDLNEAREILRNPKVPALPEKVVVAAEG
jgi:hypothetical protein